MNHPPFRRVRQPSTPLERGFYRLYHLSTLGTAVVCIWLFGYLLVGFTLHIAGIYAPEFAVMSFTDPIFITSSFIAGAFICGMAGSLTLLTLLMDVRDANAEFVILLSLIAFGFGAATMRVTFGPVQTYLAGLGGP